jgi:hypothetical protein
MPSDVLRHVPVMAPLPPLNEQEVFVVLPVHAAIAACGGDPPGALGLAAVCC